MESNSDKKFKGSNLEMGLQYVREGNLHQADMCFDAEMTQSKQTNFNVFIYHGHLLNIMGQYEQAIDKFDGFLNNHSKDVSCLFGKGISNMGLLKLDDALSLFEDVIKIDSSYADAYFYSAIIYLSPFYRNYDLVRAKECYGKYLILKKDFNNIPLYFKFLGVDLSQDKLGEYYDKMHSFYPLNDTFKVLNQLLERECSDNSIEYSYKQLKLLNKGELTPEQLEKKNSELEAQLKACIEKELEYLYDKKLINDLSSKFNGLAFESKITLREIFNSSKYYDLSFSDLNSLIRENVIGGNETIDSFYQNLKNLITSYNKKKNRELDRLEGENKKLKNENDNLNESFKSVFSENKSLEKEKEELKEENYKLSMEKKELSNRIKNFKAYQSDIKSTDNIFGDDFKNACSLNRISGINYEDYQKDLDVLASKNDIPEEELSIFKSAFKEYGAGNFNEAYELFNKFSGNFKWPQEYITFLKATSLSSANKIEEAYNLIYMGTKAKLGKKYDKNKYPILWFNFGNIFFDYAQSIGKTKDSSSNITKEVSVLPAYCYKNADSIISKPKSNYKFNFNEKVTEEELKKDAKMMFHRAEVYKNLLYLDKLKDQSNPK